MMFSIVGSPMARVASSTAWGVIVVVNSDPMAAFPAGLCSNALVRGFL
jgi:hypothetical protein